MLPKKCPKCGSTDIVQSIGSSNFSADLVKAIDALDDPNRPAPYYECWKCGWKVENPAHVRYLLSRMRK